MNDQLLVTLLGLVLCGALGLELISLHQLPAASGSVTRDAEGEPGRP